MKRSLLFLPDISGFTEFVQTTELTHSQHVISELLELLIDANDLDLKLAEVEGDALFFYKEEDIPPLDEILSQIESMFSACYGHLELLQKKQSLFPIIVIAIIGFRESIGMNLMTTKLPGWVQNMYASSTKST